MSTNILIVDDNKDLADGLSVMLEIEGYIVEVCYTGADAIDRARQQEFDIYLLDIRLPDTNGIELFRSILDLQPSARIVLMTGYRIDQVLSESCQQKEVIVLRHLPGADTLINGLEKIRNGGLMLITDTSPNLMHNLKEMLSSRDWTTTCITDTHDANYTAAQTPNHSLLINLNKPLTCLIDAYLSLQTTGINEPTIILASTAMIDGHADPLQSVHVTGCLFKPFSTDDLLHTLKYLTSDKDNYFNCRSKSI